MSDIEEQPLNVVFHKVKGVDYAFLGYKGEGYVEVEKRAREANLAEEFDCENCQVRIDMGYAINIKIRETSLMLLAAFPKAINEVTLDCQTLAQLARHDGRHSRTNCQ